MSIKSLLKEQLIVAMREKDTIRKSVITLLRAAILQVEKDTKTELDDPGVIAIISKQLKQRNDSLEAFNKAGRSDLIEVANEEIRILSSYLPEQISDEELMAIVKDAIEQSGATSVKDLGKAMQIIMPKVQGKADGKKASAMAKAILDAGSQS